MSNQPSPWGNYQFAPSTQRPGGGYSLPPPDPEHDQLGDAAKKSLGLGIGALILCCCPIVGVTMGVLAIMYGRGALQSDNPTTKTLGIAGMVCGGIAIVLSAIVLVLGIIGQVIDLQEMSRELNRK